MSKKLQITKRKLLNLSETRQHINGKQENLFVPFRIENRKELARSLTRLFFEFRVLNEFFYFASFRKFLQMFCHILKLGAAFHSVNTKQNNFVGQNCTDFCY